MENTSGFVNVYQSLGIGYPIDSVSNLSCEVFTAPLVLVVTNNERFCRALFP